MKKYPTKLPWAQGELMGNCPKKRNIANTNALIAGLYFLKVILENDNLLWNRKNSLYERESKGFSN
ncbi:MAG TPA: hypothetical protein DIW61_17245 [Candidatus Aminicenantes bacterium]|nr:hypothetical protein [Candidatus Aminicenantes bacterium]